MHLFRTSLLLLGVSCALPLCAAEGEAAGFMEDSELRVLLRNSYFNRSKQDGRRDSRDWTQGVVADYASGFTQGQVGFGLDLVSEAEQFVDLGIGHAEHGSYRGHRWTRTLEFQCVFPGPATHVGQRQCGHESVDGLEQIHAAAFGHRQCGAGLEPRDADRNGLFGRGQRVRVDGLADHLAACGDRVTDLDQGQVTVDTDNIPHG